MGQERDLEPIHVFSFGSFGRGVAEQFEALSVSIYETIVTDESIPVSQIWPATSANVVVAWRPAPKLCKLVDQVSQQSGRPFIPAVLDSMILRVGPVVLPGGGPCWDCWTRRRRQHPENASVQSSLLEHYEAHPSDGPRGYIQPVAMIAAARIAQLISNLDADAELAGSLWQIDINTQEIVTSRVVGVHGCPCCGLRRPPSSRNWTEMKDKLAFLWNQGQVEA